MTERSEGIGEHSPPGHYSGEGGHLTVLLFHSVFGLRPAVRAAAGRIRATGRPACPGRNGLPPGDLAAVADRVRPGRRD